MEIAMFSAKEEIKFRSYAILSAAAVTLSNVDCSRNRGSVDNTDSASVLSGVGATTADASLLDFELMGSASDEFMDSASVVTTADASPLDFELMAIVSRMISNLDFNIVSIIHSHLLVFNS